MLQRKDRPGETEWGSKIDGQFLFVQHELSYRAEDKSNVQIFFFSDNANQS